MLGCGGLGVVIERFAYRPLRDAPRIAPLISALGVSFFLQNSALILFGSDYRSYDTFEPRRRSSGIHIGDVYIWMMRILVVASAVGPDDRAHAVRRRARSSGRRCGRRRSTARRRR